jgi:hypothetical protein
MLARGGLLFSAGFGGIAAVWLLAACGDRTGLLVPDGLVDVDGAGDGLVIPGDDAAPDDSDASDASVSADADAAPVRDALPPLDVNRPDAPLSSRCPDAATTYIYVVTSDQELLSFDPASSRFVTIGPINCPTTEPDPSGGNATPFSMAVDRTGVAYVVYSNGELFRVSTATASCRATGFVPHHTGFDPTFGMGYSSDPTGGGETLFISGNNDPTRLGTIDPMTFRVHTVGAFDPAIHGAELTGTGAGDLFAFYALDRGRLCDATTGSCPDSAIGQLDKSSGTVTNQAILSGISPGTGWAFGFWGGDFYTFTAPPSSGGTVVHRYRPTDGSVLQVAALDAIVVGAGVSTCAPVQ